MIFIVEILRKMRFRYRSLGSVFLMGLLIPNLSFSQKVFPVKFVNQADVKIFEVAFENQADLKVCKVDFINQAGECDGNWFFTDFEKQAAHKLFSVEFENQADLKIFYVKFRNQAGWQNEKKKQLFCKL